MNHQDTLQALMATPTRIPAPAGWAAVDAPRRPRLMAVRVVASDGTQVSYSRRYSSAMDAYEEALGTYPRCQSIDVQPAE